MFGKKKDKKKDKREKKEDKRAIKKEKRKDHGISWFEFSGSDDE